MKGSTKPYTTKRKKNKVFFNMGFNNRWKKLLRRYQEKD